MDDNEVEYRLPAKVLTNRDPILMNRLSIREFLQWLFFFGLIYLGFNFLPFDFYIRMVIATCIAMFAFLFIHAPINGLAGIEWLYIWLRYRLEKRQHHTQPPLSLALITSQRPTIQVAMSLADRAKTPATETYIPLEGEL
ncbi:MAG: hypothetical protein J0I20_29140 [Chloroflexi bacterium]|jgi:hypothetical protein|nr:hypothetical protein [Chloroflexota bacterium]OJV91698.1 MAG: hypothetical protein BGO39_32975 [Chloroflexi bacterium 54-19]